MATSTRVPRRLDQFVPWLQSHVTLWTGQGTPPDIGLTTTQVADLAALTTDFVNKYDLAQAARADAKAATAGSRCSISCASRMRSRWGARKEFRAV